MHVFLIRVDLMPSLYTHHASINPKWQSKLAILVQGTSYVQYIGAKEIITTQVWGRLGGITV